MLAREWWSSTIGMMPTPNKERVTISGHDLPAMIVLIIAIVVVFLCLAGLIVLAWTMYQKDIKRNRKRERWARNHPGEYARTSGFGKEAPGWGPNGKHGTNDPADLPPTGEISKKEIKEEQDRKEQDRKRHGGKK